MAREISRDLAPGWAVDLGGAHYPVSNPILTPVCPLYPLSNPIHPLSTPHIPHLPPI